MVKVTPGKVIRQKQDAFLDRDSVLRRKGAIYVNQDLHLVGEKTHHQILVTVIVKINWLERGRGGDGNAASRRGKATFAVVVKKEHRAGRIDGIRAGDN